MESDNLNILVDDDLFTEETTNTACPDCEGDLNRSGINIYQLFKRSSCKCDYCPTCINKLLKIKRSKKRSGKTKLRVSCKRCNNLIV